MRTLILTTSFILSLIINEGNPVTTVTVPVNDRQQSFPGFVQQPYVADETKDSLKYMVPDFFEIDSAQFKKFISGHSARWFVTSDTSARLFFVPYTDYSITTAVLTESDTLPKNIMNLLDFEGVKYKDISNAIRSKNFVSRKGFRSGVSRQFA